MTSDQSDCRTVVDEKKSIRHAEKRRTSTCFFADRVAQISVEHYRRLIPESDRPPQTCLATIVAHDSENDGALTVLGFGVGTKFLPESILRAEAKASEYGRRVRDCHAEVLARRAFRRQLSLEILQELKSVSTGALRTDGGILERSPTSPLCYRLRAGVTLHLYTSSAPCGNAALKKFAKMSKEKLREDLGPEDWPQEPHEPILGSSIQLGQFALLIKKDSEGSSTTDDDHSVCTSSNRQAWPAMISDDWTPPGTTIVGMTHKGSIHTCSDKICRWNYLGLQGSLLASIIEEPIYPSSLTVGRKFTSCICRRAVCCRMEGGHGAKKSKKKAKEELVEKEDPKPLPLKKYRHNHPAVMGTAVYMDDSGVVETNSNVRGQDVRFHSSQSWCWWPFVDQEKYPGYIEQLDGSSGFVWNSMHDDNDYTGDKMTALSGVSTESLTGLFLEVRQHLHGSTRDDTEIMSKYPLGKLEDLRNLKQEVSPFYEASKSELFSKHQVFRQWRRRSCLPPEET